MFQCLFMCGIAGIANLGTEQPVSSDELSLMLSAMRHRGPDEFGIYADDEIGLGNARLRIIDLATGQQPIESEDGTTLIVFNGEIFNYPELRSHLEVHGHRFRTQTDTEVALHAYEQYGVDALGLLNGDFAMAIWNSRNRVLFLARDRVGVRPLFYTIENGRFIFASEIKAVAAVRRDSLRIDADALDQIFTFWSTLSPKTAFEGILELPPAHYLLLKDREVRIQRYWQLQLQPASQDAEGPAGDRAVEELRALVTDAVRVRLRADVPVGVYMSGGVDSAVVAAAVRGHRNDELHTFSLEFSDSRFDERECQRRLAAHFATQHHTTCIDAGDIGRVFPEVIAHAEVPILRTAPAPMLLLSRFAKQSGMTVVLTGEGSDEFLGGYDIFKETAIRRFWARQPESRFRPRLLKRLYQDIPQFVNGHSPFTTAFFERGLTDTSLPYYSHAPRWQTTSRIKRFFSDDLARTLNNKGNCLDDIAYSEEFSRLGPLEKAQYLEATIFLPQYLLSSQGDRVSMANAVEARSPFLDYRLIEYSNRLPGRLKMRGLRDKYLLRRLAGQLLPDWAAERRKQPFRAPICRAFLGSMAPEYVRDMLSPAAINQAGFFNANAVGRLVNKGQRNGELNEIDEMALAGILSTQLLHDGFVVHRREVSPLRTTDNVRVWTRSRSERTSRQIRGRAAQ